MKPWMLWSGVGAAAAAAVLAGLLFLPDSDSPPDAEADAQKAISYGDHLAEQARLAELGYDVHTDSDGDGLADVMENFLYGSDPQAFSTTGNDIPDGWFARYGYDPTVAGVESKPAAVPPTEALPDVYNGFWPDKYSWTLSDVYRYGIDHANETFHDNGIDPNEWAAPSGLPMAWLVHHEPPEDYEDWNITDPTLAESSPSDDGFTVHQNYEHDTDPHLVDTDGDGLSDQKETDRYGTDPTRFSSSGTGVPDGWLVHHELDPLDVRVGSVDPAGKGLTVAGTWEYNLDRFSPIDALAGDGLDPNQMSHRGDAVPDGWLVANGLDPLEAGVTKSESQCASEYEGVKHLDAAPEGTDTIPELCLSVEQAYLHGRPATWSEKDNGPWPGGLDPSNGDQDGDGLPDAIEIRGWYVQRFVDVGPGAKGEWIHVTSDPLREDTDGDGLSDPEEYHGEAEREVAYRFPATDPSNPDTAFSGMTDAEKVFASFDGTSWQLHEEEGGVLRPLLDPTRRDTAGDFLADGAAMAFWAQASRNVLGGVRYDEVYPGSDHGTYLEWINGLAWVAGELGVDEAAKVLAPDGDADGDGLPNIVDPFASGDNLRNGWQVDPSTLRFSHLTAPSVQQPRQATDPANPDTDGDGLDDWWELRHGQWSQAIGGWDLDPTKSKSDPNGDGESDAEGNLDGDVVAWHSYENGRETPKEWKYNNLREFQAEPPTDPRVKDETGDGVTEGWVAFWFKSYPSLIAAIEEAEDPDDARKKLPEDPGERIPTTADIGGVHGDITDVSTVGGRVKDEVEYYRVVILPSEAPDASFLGPGEDYIDGWPAQIEVAGEDGGSSFLAMIEGAYGHTHAHDQAWGLNPYLEDTDGDGMRDAWEAYYGAQPGCGDNLHPALPRPGDADGDGLPDLTEYIRGDGDQGPSPCMADTDLDGIGDKDEIFLPARNPVFPEDAGVGAGLDDTDGDGRLDSDEVRPPTPTDPTDLDTDRDGLMDGLDMPESDNTQWLHETAPSGLTWQDEYKSFGIAHKQIGCSTEHQDKSHCFYGDEANRAKADESDSIIRGIPDGWSVYYGQTSEAENKDVLRLRYACGLPAWWDQPTLGVWWWGLPATGGSGNCPRDRDMDGLDDANGEDPVPAASQSNRAAAVDLRDMMANTSTPASHLVRAAQAWGECAGNPEPCSQQWNADKGGLTRRVSVDIEDLDVSGLVGSDEVKKEEAFEVTGHLVVACSDAPCQGAPNRTVVVRLAGPDPLTYDVLSDDVGQNGITLGVAFTNETGHFTVEGCLCARPGTIEVDKGLVALGRSNTTAAWDTHAADVPVGSEWVLGVHAYASTATFWGDGITPDSTHPQYLGDGDGPFATGSDWTALPGTFNVTSDTTLAIDVPDKIAWGDDRLLPVTVTLRDDSGGAVAGQDVSVTMTGGAGSMDGTVSTDDHGEATVELPLGGRTGIWHVAASYGGNTTMGWGGAVSAPSTVTLQAPLELVASDDTPAVRLGTPAEFTVTAHSQTRLVAGVDVTVTLGTLTKTATTGEDGVATFTITPTGMDPGAAQITFRASSTSGYAAASATQPISLVSGSLLHTTVPETGSLDAPLSLAGHLILTDGTPLSDKKIHATLAEQSLGSFTTKSDGRFDGAPIVPLDLGIGVHTLRLTYAGETDAIDAATVQKSVRFSVGTQLRLDDVHAGRGQDAWFKGRLTSITSHPLVGEDVNITLPWNETVTVKARSGGNFTKSITIPSSHALGAFQIYASYDGSTNGTYGASQATALLEIGSPSRIEADALGIMHRGNNTVTGRLRDDETGAPIADAEIRATPSVGEPLTIQTDEEGRYQFSLSLPRTIPAGDINVTLRFDGDDGYAPTQNTSHGTLRVPASLTISGPPELGRGTSHPVVLLLTDDRKAPLPDRVVTLTALGSTWNATTDSEGKAHFPLDVPLDAPLGVTRIGAAFGGEAAHDAAQATREATVKDGVRITIHGMPDNVVPGQRVPLRIHVEDTNGQPVQTPLAVRLEGVPGSLLVETNDAGFADATIIVPDTGTQALRVTIRFPGTELLASRSENLEPTLGTAAHAAAPATGWPWGITAGAAAVAVSATALVVLRRRNPNAADILEDTRKRIDAGDPWSTAVLEAYRRLVELVKAYGILDAENQTGRAFAQTLVDAGFLQERAAMHLVALFERARYAGETLDPADAHEAQRVLQRTLGSVQRIETHRGVA